MSMYTIEDQIHDLAEASKSLPDFYQKITESPIVKGISLEFFCTIGSSAHRLLVGTNGCTLNSGETNLGSFSHERVAEILASNPADGFVEKVVYDILDNYRRQEVEGNTDFPVRFILL